MFSGITSKLFNGLRMVAYPRLQTRELPPFHVRAGQFPPHGTYTYRMTLDPYSPDMLDVKVVGGEIVVRGKIEERVGEDRWTYEFVKRHRLPRDVDLTTVKTSFENGQLVVTAKMKALV